MNWLGDELVYFEGRKQNNGNAWILSKGSSKVISNLPHHRSSPCFSVYRVNHAVHSTGSHAITSPTLLLKPSSETLITFPLCCTLGSEVAQPPPWNPPSIHPSRQ